MRVIVAAAGTSGHINPGIAIAKEIQKNEESEIIFIGTNRGLENDIVPKAGYELKHIDSYGFTRKINFDTIKKLMKTFGSIYQAKKILKEFKPDIVIATGGYISISVCIAAKKLKIPYVVHESNMMPGLATKVLSKHATRILTGFESAKENLNKNTKIEFVGNPSNVKNLDITEKEKSKVKKELGLKNKKTILVFGGSQGSKKINDTIIELSKEKLNYQIIFAPGKANFEEVNAKIDNKNIYVVPYIYNMEEILNTVDLVIARSGAMTITELQNVGKPAIFIPLPNVSNNHQEHNARMLEKVGGAKVILDNELAIDTLKSMLDELINNDELLDEMGKLVKETSKTGVTEEIYKIIKKIIGEKNGG